MAEDLAAQAADRETVQLRAISITGTGIPGSLESDQRLLTSQIGTAPKLDCVLTRLFESLLTSQIGTAPKRTCSSTKFLASLLTSQIGTAPKRIIENHPRTARLLTSQIGTAPKPERMMILSTRSLLTSQIGTAPKLPARSGVLEPRSRRGGVWLVAAVAAAARVDERSRLSGGWFLENGFPPRGRTPIAGTRLRCPSRLDEREMLYKGVGGSFPPILGGTEPLFVYSDRASLVNPYALGGVLVRAPAYIAPYLGGHLVRCRGEAPVSRADDYPGLAPHVSHA